MTALAFHQQHKPPEELRQVPERQRDWYEFRKNRKIAWHPRTKELQYIGSLYYSFDRGHVAVGSFRPDKIINRQCPRITHIDSSVVSALSERRIVWTPNHRAEGNIDRTQWKAYYIKVCRSNYPDLPIEIRYAYANDATFDTFEVTADTQRIKLYIAKSLRDIYRTAPIDDERSKHQYFKVTCAANKNAWHKRKKCARSGISYQGRANPQMMLMKGIENKVLSQDELQDYINGKIRRDEVLRLITRRTKH